MQPLSRQTTISGLVWVFCGLAVMAVVAIKVSFLTRSAPVYWEYVGGLMIVFGLVRLLWGLVRGGKNTKPPFLARVILTNCQGGRSNFGINNGPDGNSFAHKSLHLPTHPTRGAGAQTSHFFLT